jgi:hypothetical protein
VNFRLTFSGRLTGPGYHDIPQSLESNVMISCPLCLSNYLTMKTSGGVKSYARS